MDNVLNENEKIINNIKASMSFEGMNLDKSDIDLINSFLDNKITEQEGIEIIKMNLKICKEGSICMML